MNEITDFISKKMRDRTQRIIGLTGGIGTGKTTVSNYLANTYHLPILDADIYAREAVSLNSPILPKVVDRYGTDILLGDRTLNRKKLGDIIFNNPDERRWIEQQIHPYVRQRFAEATNDLSLHSTIVWVVPLLFEANLTDLVTEIWVVYCSPEKQLERLIARDSLGDSSASRLTPEQAQSRINAQMAIEEKCDRADVILDNSSTLENLLKQVDFAVKNAKNSS